MPMLAHMNPRARHGRNLSASDVWQIQQQYPDIPLREIEGMAWEALPGDPPQEDPPPPVPDDDPAAEARLGASMSGGVILPKPPIDGGGPGERTFYFSPGGEPNDEELRTRLCVTMTPDAAFRFLYALVAGMEKAGRDGFVQVVFDAGAGEWDDGDDATLTGVGSGGAEHGSIGLFTGTAPAGAAVRSLPATPPKAGA
jgi:hypothetical protein